jgi:hypothetical protein
VPLRITEVGKGPGAERRFEELPVLGDLGLQGVHLRLDIDVAVRVELDVEPTTGSLRKLVGGHHLELAQLEPGLAHLKLRSEASERVQPLPDRERLDPRGDSRSVDLGASGRGDEIIHRNVDHRKLLPGIPSGRVKRRRQLVSFEDRQHVRECRDPAVVDGDGDRRPRQAALLEPVDRVAQRQHRQA